MLACYLLRLFHHRVFVFFYPNLAFFPMRHNYIKETYSPHLLSSGIGIMPGYSHTGSIHLALLYRCQLED